MYMYDNREKYVQVRDLEIGKEGTYTDYEELTFQNDPEKFVWLKDLEDLIRSYKLTPDQSDLIFYNSIHILYDLQLNVGVPNVEDVSTIVDTSYHLLCEVMRCQAVRRPDIDW